MECLATRGKCDINNTRRRSNGCKTICMAPSMRAFYTDKVSLLTASLLLVCPTSVAAARQMLSCRRARTILPVVGVSFLNPSLDELASGIASWKLFLLAVACLGACKLAAQSSTYCSRSSSSEFLSLRVVSSRNKASVA